MGQSGNQPISPVMGLGLLGENKTLESRLGGDPVSRTKIKH